MLIEKVIDYYVDISKKHPGNPIRLSNSGRIVPRFRRVDNA